jgi:Uma2 family endonuclease
MRTPAFIADTWVQASWETFLTLSVEPALTQAKCYYNRGWMRIEMSPVGPSHAQDNGLIASIIAQWLLSRELPLFSYINPTLRKSGLQEAQPDLAYFAGNAQSRPTRSNRPIDLAAVAPPVLAVEISASTLEDDLSVKRALYAELGVREYWVVDVEAVQVRMFSLKEKDAALVEVQDSQVLAGLHASLVEAALQRGQRDGDAAAMRVIANTGNGDA